MISDPAALARSLIAAAAAAADPSPLLVAAQVLLGAGRSSSIAVARTPRVKLG